MKYTQAAGEKSTVKLTITFSEEEWQRSEEHTSELQSQR